MARLCEISPVKNAAKIAPGYAAHDEKVGLAIDMASAAIQSYIRRDLTSQTYTEYFDVPKKDWGHPYHYWLAGMNVTGLQAYLSSPSDFDDVDPLDTIDYRVRTLVGKFTLLAGSTAIVRSGLKVTYTAGYAVDTRGVFVDLPASITNAAIAQSVYTLERLVESELGQKTEKSQPGVSLQLERASYASILPEAQFLVKEYMRLSNPSFF